MTMMMTNYDVSDDGADNRLAQFFTQVNLLGIKRFVPGISISFNVNKGIT